LGSHRDQRRPSLEKGTAMGITQEGSLVVKHTFLEYVIPDRSPKQAPVLFDTDEVLESVGLISISPTSMLGRATAALFGSVEEATAAGEAAPAGRPTWPVTPLLDAVFEPDVNVLKGQSGVDLLATTDLKAALGICGSAGDDLWLPASAADMGGMAFEGPWVFMPYPDFENCGQWQDACWAEGFWPPATSSTASGDAESVAGSSDADGHGPGGELRTTVMLRNLPKTLGRSVLLRRLDSMGFVGQYDFVYVPVDFSTGVGLGYAFINMCVPGAATKVWEAFEGMAQWDTDSDTVCSVSWSDPHQGLAAHIERYQNSPVMHADVPDEWKPALFMSGMRVEFPPPTKKIKAPKVRSKKAEAA